MKSVSVIEYTRGKEGLDDKLEETSRHFATVWSTAVAHVAENTILESDAEGNLMVLHQNTSGVTADDRRRLEVTSEIRLGEMVNRIQSFEVPASKNPTVVPRAFLGTVSHTILCAYYFHKSICLLSCIESRWTAQSTSSPSLRLRTKTS